LREAKRITDYYYCYYYYYYYNNYNNNNYMTTTTTTAKTTATTTTNPFSMAVTVRAREVIFLCQVKMFTDGVNKILTH